MNEELERVIDEVRLLWNALVQWGDGLHGSTGISMGMRAVLEYLARNGPSAVPAIARARGVSRQFIQTLVNGLLDEGYVENAPNPAHRRSPLVALTPAGERTIRAMRRNERAALDASKLDLSEARLQRTASTLRAIRAALSS